MMPDADTSIDGPPMEASSCSRSWMNVSGPRKVTLSIFGWIEVLAPVPESNVSELNVMPMNEAASPRPTST